MKFFRRKLVYFCLAGILFGLSFQCFGSASVPEVILDQSSLWERDLLLVTLRKSLPFPQRPTRYIAEYADDRALEAFEEEFLRNNRTIASLVNSNLLQLHPKEHALVQEASFKSLRALSLLSDSDEEDVLRTLISLAARGFGQLTHLCPSECHKYDKIFNRYLRTNKLTYADLRAPHWPFKFGSRYPRMELDPEKLLVKLSNGQVLCLRYFMNMPVKFNRLFSEFDGYYLLIGGGKKCECGQPSRHPKDLFYQIDIDQQCEPDLVMNAEYIPHLSVFPTERFSLIWIEHCTIILPYEKGIFWHYFRTLRPGGLMVLQSNYIIPGHEDRFDDYNKSLMTLFKQHKFAIMQQERQSIFHQGKIRRFDQLIVQKPYRNSPLSKPSSGEFSLFSSSFVIDTDLYRQPSKSEAQISLIQALILTHQPLTREQEKFLESKQVRKKGRGIRE